MQNTVSNQHQALLYSSHAHTSYGLRSHILNIVTRHICIHFVSKRIISYFPRGLCGIGTYTQTRTSQIRVGRACIIIVISNRRAGSLSKNEIYENHICGEMLTVNITGTCESSRWKNLIKHQIPYNECAKSPRLLRI